MLNGSRRAGAELALAIGGDWVLTGWQLGGEELERSQTGSRQESSFTQVLLVCFHFMSFGLLILQSWISCWIVEMRIFNDFQTIVYQRNCSTFKAIPPKKSGEIARWARDF